MKTLLSLVAGLSVLHSATALEYVTLRAGNVSHDIFPGSLVEIVGIGGRLTSASWAQLVRVTFPDGATEGARIDNELPLPPLRYAGISRVELQEPFNFSVTFKITPPNEINAAGPTNILVIPENAPGNFDLIVDSSTDLVTWTPIFSQTVVNGSTSHFFRARLVKK